MTRKRNFKTTFFLLLRRFGMLCKIPRKEKPKLRIARTVYPEGRNSSIEAEQYVWIQTRLLSKPQCKFNADTRSCVCGVKTIEEFAFNCNKA